MAGPWEKYQQGDGPWSKYARQQPNRVTPKAKSPEELARAEYDAMPFWQRVVVSAGGESLALARGIKNLVAPPEKTVADVVAGRDPARAAADADAPFQDAMHGPSNWIGRAAPYLATAAFGGPEAAIVGRLPAAAGAATRLAAMALPAALEGAALGGAREVRTGESRGANAAIGASAGIVGRGLLGAGRWGLNRLGQSGTDRAAANMLLREAMNPESLLAPQPSATPGLVRTLAEESRDPGIARLEQTNRGRPGFNWGARDTAANTAQRNVLEGIAGTDADMAAAHTARQQAADMARQSAMQAGPVDISGTLAHLDNAIGATEGRSAVQPALKSLRARLLKADGTPEDRINVLENIRQDIGDMLAGRFGGDSAAALKGSRELIGVRDALNNEIGGQVPAFADYLNAYRQGSIPINRMEIGRDLLERAAQGARTDNVGMPMLSPAKLAKLPRDLDAVASRATGFSKASADRILSPQDMAAIKALQDDGERAYIAATAGTGGNSATSARLGVVDRAVKSGVGMLPVVGKYANGLISMIADRDAAKVEARVGELLANPAEARRVLGSLSANQAGQLYRLLSPRTARAAQALIADRPRAKPLLEYDYSPAY